MRFLLGIKQHNRFLQDREGRGNTKHYKLWINPFYQSDGEQLWLWDNKLRENWTGGIWGEPQQEKKSQKEPLKSICFSYILYVEGRKQKIFNGKQR